MKLKIILSLWVIAAIAIVAFVFVRQPSAEAQGVVSIRDDVNGYLCFDFRAWGQCDRYTPTPAETPTPPTPPGTEAPDPTEPPRATLTPIPTLTTTPTQAPPAVSIVNPGFEQGLTGWTQFTLNGSADLNSERVSQGADVLAAHGGDGSARLIAHYACYRSGVYQVIGVTVGAHVRVTAWVMTLGSRVDGLHAPEPNMNSYIGLGVDPLGLTSASVSRIEWSRIVGGLLVGATHGLDPSWQQVSVETITTRQTMTVFVYGDLGKTSDGACMWAYYSLLTFIDDVTVEILP